MEMSPEQAMKALLVKVQILEEHAAEVELDRPDLARKWRAEAEKIRLVLD